MTQLKKLVSSEKKVNEQRVITKWKYLNNMSCGLAHEMVTSFCTFCVLEKKQNALPHMGTIFNMAAPLL